MNATTLAAWVGAAGTFANAAALVIVERRKARPDVTLSTKYRPGISMNGKRVEGSNPPTIYVNFNTGSDTTVSSGGLAKAGRLWFWHLVPLPCRRTQVAMFLEESRAPFPAIAGDTLAMYIRRTDAVGAGVDPAGEYVAWVRTGSGRLIRSTETISLSPEYVQRKA